MPGGMSCSDPEVYSDRFPAKAGTRLSMRPDD
jgi:hypothetical protein